LALDRTATRIFHVTHVQALYVQGANAVIPKDTEVRARELSFMSVGFGISLLSVPAASLEGDLQL
jgi:hypothetical protein